MDFRGIFILVLCLCLHFVTIGGKKVEGTITKENSEWEFITRFCFLSQKGSMRYTFEFPKSYGVQNILLYFDEQSQWSSVYKSSKNCEQKVAVLDPANNQIIALSVLYAWSGCKEITRGGTPYISCYGGRTFRSTRERWWFVAVSRCDQSTGPKGINISYEISMINSKKDNDFLHREYSADEFYIFPIDVTFMGLYILLVTGAIICAIVLRMRQLFHTTYKMYVSAVIFYALHMFFTSLAFGLLGSTGWERPKIKFLGRMCGALSDLIFLLMLILVGKGYTITRGRLPTSSTVKIAVFFTMYILCYTFLFAYEAVVFDPGEVLYLYESPAGYGLIGMKLVGWGWFCYSVFFTVKHYKNKSLFYYPFFIFYTIWFWCGPILVICAMLKIPLWMREKVVHGNELFLYFAGHLFFQILTRPQAANKNFPYHVRTTQIACMTGVNSHELDNFKNNAYDIASDDPRSRGPDLTNLFTTSQTTTSGEKDDKNYDDFFVTSSTTKRASLPPSYSAAQLMQLGGDSEDHPPPRPVMAAAAGPSSGMGRRATMPNFLLSDQHDHNEGLPGTSGASGVHRASIALPPRAGDFPGNRSTLPPIGLRGSTSTTNINTPPNYHTLFTVGE